MYIVKRFYEDGRKPRIMAKNLSLEKAQEWCQDPETSSRTCTKSSDNANWFDGYDKQ